MCLGAWAFPAAGAGFLRCRLYQALLAGEKVRAPSGAERSRAEPREPREPSGAERSRAERGTPSLNGLSAELNLEPCYFCRAKGPRKGVVLILIVLMAQDQDLHDSS